SGQASCGAQCSAGPPSSIWLVVQARRAAAREILIQTRPGAGYRLSVGISLQSTGDITEGRAHYDQAIALYDPVEHRPLVTRFGQDSRVVNLSRRSAALWLLGYPEAALADAESALRKAREIGHAATLMYALSHGAFARYQCGNYASANAVFDELAALAEQKGTLFWKAFGIMNQGCVCALTGQPLNAVRMITSGWQSTGATMWMPFFLSYLARAHGELGKFED